MTGWIGTILRVDLTRRRSWLEHPPADLLHAWIGGKGLAGRILHPHATRSCDDPELPVVFMTGPLVGTASPTSGRMCIMSRSPLTGTVGDASVGGRLAVQMKRAGYDGLVITGRSEAPCGLDIADEAVSFVDGRDLWGVGTADLLTRLGRDGAVACIGPAAENGVLFASIVAGNGHVAGRNGLGAVLAAKNLKYLRVRGSGRVGVHDASALAAAREDIFRQIAASPVLLGELGIAQFGTGALYDLMDSRRMMPTANFRRTVFDGSRALNAPAYRRKYEPKRTGCQGCHILCKKVANDGTVVPEFETMSHFSALVENRDIETVTRANAICNDAGMDTISAAGTLACHAEIEGRRLTGEAILDLLRAIARGDGTGRELGQGAARYAAARGCPDSAMCVKGQELPAYDPRGAYGMALAYATSTRGGCHLRAYPIAHEILRKPVATERFSFAGKARMIKIAEDLNAVVDSLTACKFVFFATSLEEYAKVFTAVTGVPTTAQGLLDFGERVYYRERLMNAANGFSADADDLPARFFREAGSAGHGIDIRPLDRAEFLDARSRYYRIRGLTCDGRPTREKTEELGLVWGEGKGARVGCALGGPRFQVSAPDGQADQVGAPAGRRAEQPEG